MEEDPERLNQYVEDLLQDRRPERTPLGSEEELRTRQAAGMLRAARPGSGLPSPDFLRKMQQDIEGWVKERGPAVSSRRSVTRRGLLLTGLSAAAAGVVATLGVEELTKRRPPAGGEALVEQGSWKPVTSLADLAQSQPVAFRSGSLEGFLIREGDNVRALSAVCTHMGCILNWSKFRSQFECPCHGATFDSSGMNTGGYEGRPLRSLPQIQARIDRGQVEVYTV
jgi:cytochrome b6-f complex iron-sulfur subunit